MSYSRPFSGNKGKHNPSHRLRVSFVPDNLRSLHARLIKWRNELVAHTDLTVRQPKLANFGTKERPFITMSARGLTVEKELDSEICKIELLVKTVETNLHTKMAKIEQKLWPNGIGNVSK